MSDTITIPKSDYDEIIAVLNTMRIVLKNRDQHPEEMLLLASINYVVARAREERSINRLDATQGGTPDGALPMPGMTTEERIEVVVMRVRNRFRDYERDNANPSNADMMRTILMLLDLFVDELKVVASAAVAAERRHPT
jgi:hypothetical protein